MFRINILRNSIVTNSAVFETEELVNSWFEKEKLNGSFGKIAGNYPISQLNEEELATELSREENEFGQIIVSIPDQFEHELIDVTEETQKQQQIDQKIQAGIQAREVCQRVLDFITGSNLDKELTIEQITSMQQTYSQAELALKSSRPTLAKQLITLITADGVIVTEEEKEICLQMLQNY